MHDLVDCLFLNGCLDLQEVMHSAVEVSDSELHALTLHQSPVCHRNTVVVCSVAHIRKRVGRNSAERSRGCPFCGPGVDSRARFQSPKPDPISASWMVSGSRESSFLSGSCKPGAPDPRRVKPKMRHALLKNSCRTRVEGPIINPRKPCSFVLCRTERAGYLEPAAIR